MPGAGRVAAAFSGLLAAAAALGVAELVAGIAGRATASPLVAVGGAFIDLTPVWLKEWAISRFGANDNSVLTYHVAGQKITPDALGSGNFNTLQGAKLTTTGSTESYKVGDAGVVCGNVQTANATVYIIDTVLMPPTS